MHKVNPFDRMHRNASRLQFFFACLLITLIASCILIIVAAGR